MLFFILSIVLAFSNAELVYLGLKNYTMAKKEY